MKKKSVILSVALLAVFLFTAIFIISSADAQPPKPGPTLQKAKFEVNHSMKDNLAMNQGQDIVVHLKSGKSLQGRVKTVGAHFVHLEKLSGGRDYYDALIRIEDISAIEAKFRGYK